MKRTSRTRKKSKYRIWAAIITGVLAVVLVIFFMAISPMRSAHRQVSDLAERYAGIKEESAFYRYDRNKTYYTIAGTNDKKQKIYAIIAKNGKKINIYQQSEGVSEAKARQLARQDTSLKKITHVGLGMYKNKPTWEVSYLNKQDNLCYDLIDFKSGKVVKTIQNI